MGKRKNHEKLNPLGVLAERAMELALDCEWYKAYWTSVIHYNLSGSGQPGGPPPPPPGGGDQ